MRWSVTLEFCLRAERVVTLPMLLSMYRASLLMATVSILDLLPMSQLRMRLNIPSEIMKWSF